MDKRLNIPWIGLRYGLGLTATLAGLDKFFNILADWGSYVSSAAAQLLPVSIPTSMGIVGIVELAVGVAILTRWTRAGAYVASAWLVGVATNLVFAGFYDVAVRDVVMAVGAFTLARLEEVRREAPTYGLQGAGHHITGRATA
jgi:hypothetical protein